MTEAEQEALREVLIGYFGDRTRDEGIRDMLGITRAREDYHQRYRGALEAGLTAARAGDEDAYRVVRGLRPSLPDAAAAADLLAAILQDYDRAYAAGA